MTCERYINWLPLTCPHLGVWPATQACALSGNQTSNLSICKPELTPLSHTSQGCSFFKKNSYLMTLFHCFREREVREGGRGRGERERETERHQFKREILTGCLPYLPEPKILCIHIGDQACNLGMCCDRESNLQPFCQHEDIPGN